MVLPVESLVVLLVVWGVTEENVVEVVVGGIPVVLLVDIPVDKEDKDEDVTRETGENEEEEEGVDCFVLLPGICVVFVDGATVVVGTVVLDIGIAVQMKNHKD